MTEKQKEMYSALIGLSSERAVDLILNCYGTQLLNDSFYEFLLEEEILEEEMIEYEDNDDDDEKEGEENG